jgi:hypothetical protein
VLAIACTLVVLAIACTLGAPLDATDPIP